MFIHMHFHKFFLLLSWYSYFLVHPVKNKMIHEKRFHPIVIRFMQLVALQNFLTTDHWCSSLHDKKLNFLRDIFSVKLLLEVNQERPTFTLVILISVLEIILQPKRTQAIYFTLSSKYLKAEGFLTLTIWVSVK